MTVQVISISPPPNSKSNSNKKNNPLNPLSKTTRNHLYSSIDTALNDPAVTSIVLFGGTNFSAGADISEFSAKGKSKAEQKKAIASSSETNDKSIGDICQLIESSSTTTKPIIACITGVALGGGLEVALACHYRIAVQVIPTTTTKSTTAATKLSASSKIQIGLPEVSIGLIPGAGGTQRLPRVCHGGIPNFAWALNVVVTGRMVGVEEAKKVGVVDDIVHVTVDVDADVNATAGASAQQQQQQQKVLEVAKKWATYAEHMGDSLQYRITSNKNVFAPDDTTAKIAAHKLCNDMLHKLPPVEKGGKAVHAAVAAVRASFDETSFERGMAVESTLFWDLLLNSPQGRGLRHAFYAERSAKKVILPSSSSSSLVKSSATSISTTAQSLLDPKKAALVGVIGAGTMGSGIAISFLRAGYKVILVDTNTKGLDRGSKLISNVLKQDVKKKRMTKDKVEYILKNHFQTCTDMAAAAATNTNTNCELKFSNCSLVIEAVFENLKIKQSIFTQLDQVIQNPHALLLSNTSTLSIDAIASALPPSRRPYCAGMHFFSPAHVMKLVEIVVSSSTSSETTSTVQQITTKRLRKVGVVVGNCEGFVGNRMLFPYTGEAVFVLEEGRASVSQVDDAIVQFGMAIGPMNMGDLAGNDIGYLIRKGRGLVKDADTGLPGPNRVAGMRYTDLGDDLVAVLGRVGQKQMKGWYDYDPKVGRGRKPIPSKEVEQFIAKYYINNTNTGNDTGAGAGAGAVAKKKYSPKEIVERVLFPLVNEGFKILEEGIARSPSDIDVIYLYGYGWPAWRGGPMYWADNEVGLAYLLEQLEQMNDQFPGSTYYVPSMLLRKCVALGITVEDYYDRGLHLSQSHSKSKL